MAAPNIVLGSGKVYFNLLNTAGVYQGERYIAQTPGFTINAASESLDYEDVDTKISEILFTVTTKITRTARIECRDMNDDNYALFVIGSVATQTQVSTPVANEAIAGVKKDRYYQLGATLANPTGIRAISAVTVTGPSATPVYTVNTDYTVDLSTGRLYIVPTGAIADNANLEVDYTPTAGSRLQVVSNTIGENYGALRFVADNTIGANRDLYAPYVLLKPSGDLPLKSRTDYQVATFDLSFLRKEGYAQMYVDQRAVA
jgi:hypothetical protein